MKFIVAIIKVILFPFWILGIIGRKLFGEFGLVIGAGINAWATRMVVCYLATIEIPEVNLFGFMVMSFLLTLIAVEVI